jgi:hypothetical protein
MPNALELVEVDSDRLEEVVRHAEQSLDEKDAAVVRAVFESYAYVTELVEDKNTSIRRLRLLESLAVVYRNDAEARERRLSPEARLRFHQEASGPNRIRRSAARLVTRSSTGTS